ncbi:MAG: hypothetical protein KC501_20665 [Myxococcales bacterium]|nr:hypothetical protein [Myxococcales bacterium]
MAMQSGVVIPDEEAPPSAPEPTPTHAAPAHGTNGKARPGTNGAPVSGLEPAGPIMGAGPCLPPPAADGVVPWEELSAFEAWEQLVGRIRGEDEFLSAVLGEVGLVELAGGTLRVASPRGSFAHTELTRHPQVRAQIEQACRDHLGAPFTVELVEGDPMLPELPSVVLVAQQRRAEHRAQVEAEARAHPAIQTLLRTFDASLVSTKPLHEP